jgi:hypothetical protein
MYVAACSGGVLQAPAFVAGFDDVAVIRETVEQSGCHLWIAEDGRPFAEGEVGRDNDGGALVEAAHEVEQELASSLLEGQIAEFIEDHEVEASQIIGQGSRS